MYIVNPGKSCGLKFIPNQSYLFRFIPKSESAPIQKKISRLIQIGKKLIRLNPRFLILTKIQSDLIELNPRLAQSESIRKKFLIPRSE